MENVIKQSADIFPAYEWMCNAIPGRKASLASTSNAVPTTNPRWFAFARKPVQSLAHFFCMKIGSLGLGQSAYFYTPTEPAEWRCIVGRAFIIRSFTALCRFQW